MKAEDNPFPYVTLVEQASTPATPASGRAKLYRGTDNKQYILDDTGAATEVGGASGGGSAAGVLAVTAYNPGTLASYPCTTTTAADVDATNLAVTFTAPASGKVLVKLHGFYQPAINSAGYTSYFWTLQEGTTTVASRTMQGYNYSSAADQIGTAEFYITGLTPGSSHTYKWAHRTDVANKPGRVYAGGIAGAAIMQVTAAP